MKKIFKSSDIRYINVVSFGNEKGYTTPGEISLFPGLPVNPLPIVIHAADIVYSNTASGLSGQDVQAAIDELAAIPPGGGMTDAQVKTAYENNADTNAFDDSAKAQLALNVTGIEHNLALINTNIQSITDNKQDIDSLILENKLQDRFLGVDIDTIFIAGKFTVDTNLPHSITHGILDVTQLTGPAGLKIQHLLDTLTGKEYQRIQVGTGWAAWEEAIGSKRVSYHEVDWTLHMGSDQNAAFDGANSPSGSNVLATMADIPREQFKTHQHLDQVMIIKADVAQDESILFAAVPLVTNTFTFVLAQSVELPATFHIELKNGGDQAHSAPCGDLVITATETDTYGGGRYGGGDTDYYFKGVLSADKSELTLELTKPAYLAGVTANLQLTVNENGAPHNVTSVEKVIELIDAIPAPPAPSPARNIVKTSSANYTMHPDVDILHVMGAEHHPVAITLPDATDVDDGRVFIIKDAAGHADLHNITIGAIDGQTIDGVRYMYLDHPFQNLSYYTFENNWHVIT